MATDQVSDSSTHKTITLDLPNVDLSRPRLSIAGAQIIADLSTPITVTYHLVSKIIDVPAKMIDPTSKERYIKRTLLDNVSGQICPGEVVALMGPSGSGKTTLLDTLAGRTSNGVSGDIWFNNERYDKSMKRKLGYVLQQDIFFTDLTVKQQLTYTALLRLPNHLSKADKLAQVGRVIDQLGLQKCENTPIMLISGGEKKRVNIGTELLTNPSVIFLDEPTSGLDSTSAVSLIEVLRDLSKQGKTIITSIHQPSSQIFQSFDKLILLADGKTIFMGKPSNALAYFDALGHHCPAQYNPADYVMDLVNSDNKIRDDLKVAYQKYRIVPESDSKVPEYSNDPSEKVASQYLLAEPSGNENDLPQLSEVRLTSNKEQGKWPIGFLPQLFILLSRCIRLTGKAQFTVLNFAQAIAIAVICGLCWLRMEFKESTIPDRSSFIFFIMTFWPFQTLFMGLLSFPFERTVIDKERASGSYRLSAYFIAKSLAEAPLKLVLPTIFLIIAYWMAQINNNFANFLGILFFQLLSIIVAESFGLFLGATFTDLHHAMTAATITLIGLMLIGGFFIQRLPNWLRIWAPWLSFFNYAYSACLRLQFMGSQMYQCTDGSYVKSCLGNSNGTFVSSEALQYFDAGLQVGYDFLVLFGMFIVFRLLAYLSLRFLKAESGRT